MRTAFIAVSAIGVCLALGACGRTGLDEALGPPGTDSTSTGGVGGSQTTSVGSGSGAAGDGRGPLPAAGDQGGGGAAPIGHQTAGSTDHATGASGGPGTSGSTGSSSSGSPDPSISSSYSIDPAHDGAQDSVQIASPLTKRWSLTFDGHVSYPVIANGRVFLSMVEKGQPAVSAYNLKDGTLVWGPLFEPQVNSLTYEAGRLFGEDRNGLVQAWDEATGTVLWKGSLQAIDGQSGFDGQFPLAQGGLLYASGYGRAETVYALDERTGALRWHTKVSAAGNPITIGGGAVFLTGACQSVFAIDALTGTPSTIHSTTCSGAGGGMPVYYRGDLWVDDPKGSIIVDTTGRQVGTFPMKSASAFHDGVAFYQTGNLIAVDLETGAIKWTLEGPNLCAPPAVAGAGGRVFVSTTNGQILEIDEGSGDLISMADAGFGPTTECEPMAVAAGRLVYADENGVTVY